MRRVLVTGSSGHLGEALVRTLRASGEEAIGLDLLESPFTDLLGSVTDRSFLRTAMDGMDVVIHTAALQKPHIESHSRQAFIETNATGTEILLEEAATAGVGSFVFTSSTGAFGRALTAGAGAAASWITEEVVPLPRNIYGVTKITAENLCELASRELGLPIVILRMARFFPEPDDLDEVRNSYSDSNIKANEFTYRRLDIEDAVSACRCAIDKASTLGFARFVISAPTPFSPRDVAELATDAPAVLARLFPDQPAEYARRGWQMFPALDRVYDSSLARQVLEWSPRYDFGHVLNALKADVDPSSELARTVGAKGYHSVTTGVYTTR